MDTVRKVVKGRESVDTHKTDVTSPTPPRPSISNRRLSSVDATKTLVSEKTGFVTT